MGPFIQRHEENVTGVLSGFDRLVLRGTLRTLSYTAGMMNFLYEIGVLLKEFGGYVERTTKHLRAACYEMAQQLERPVIYLPSSQPSRGGDGAADRHPRRRQRWTDLPVELR